MLHARVYEIEDCCFKIQMTLMWLTNSVTIGDWCAFPIVLQALCVCVRYLLGWQEIILWCIVTW